MNSGGELAASLEKEQELHEWRKIIEILHTSSRAVSRDQLALLLGTSLASTSFFSKLKAASSELQA